MPEVTRREPDLALALDHHWDAVLSGRETAPDDLLDPGLAGAVRRAHALDAAPEPDPAFAARLWNNLIDTSSTSPAATPSAATTLPATSMTSPGQVLSFPLQRLSLRIAAAMLLMVLLAGSALVALYPHWSRQVSRLPLVAPPAVATPTPGTATALLLDVTISELREDKAFVQVDRYTLPQTEKLEVGGLGGNAPNVLFVEDGALQVLATDGQQPVRILRAGDEAKQELLAAGESAHVARGDGIVVEIDSAAALTSLGPGPATILHLFSPTTFLPTSGAAVTYETSAGNTFDLVAPLGLSLRRVTLDPEASLPTIEPPVVEQIVTAVDGERIMDLRTGRDGSARNAGDEPLDVYVVSLTSAPDEPATVEEALLLDVTVSEPAAYRAWISIDPYVFPTGGTARRLTGSAPEVLYVVEGELTVRMLEGTQPAMMVPPGITGPVTQGDPIAAGKEAALKTGATFVAPKKSTIEVVNTSAKPAKLFVLLMAGDATVKSVSYVGYDDLTYSASVLHDLAPTQRLMLRRVTLGPGATFAVPDGAIQEFSPVNGDKRTDLRRGSRGSLSNAGDTPIDAYVLTAMPVADSSASEPGSALLDLTLDAAPAYLALTETPAIEAWAGAAATRFPPGSSLHDVAGDAPEVVYVASGDLSARVERAPRPVEVIRPGEVNQLLSESQGTVLAAGAALMAPAGSIIELANEATAPAEALFLLVAASSSSTAAGGVERNAGIGSDSGKLIKLASPSRLLLRKLSLVGGEALPAPGAANATQIAYPLDVERLVDVRRGSDGSLRNAGAAPMAIYALTIISGAAGSLST